MCPNRPCRPQPPSRKQCVVQVSGCPSSSIVCIRRSCLSGTCRSAASGSFITLVGQDSPPLVGCSGRFSPPKGNLSSIEVQLVLRRTLYQDRRQDDCCPQGGNALTHQPARTTERSIGRRQASRNACILRVDAKRTRQRHSLRSPVSQRPTSIESARFGEEATAAYPRPRLCRQPARKRWTRRRHPAEQRQRSLLRTEPMPGRNRRGFRLHRQSVWVFALSG